MRRRVHNSLSNCSRGRDLARRWRPLLEPFRPCIVCDRAYYNLPGVRAYSVGKTEKVLKPRKFGGARRNRTDDNGFADHCLTTWRPRHRGIETWTGEARRESEGSTRPCSALQT